MLHINLFNLLVAHRSENIINASIWVREKKGKDQKRLIKQSGFEDCVAKSAYNIGNLSELAT